jgi:peptide/nickel transport system permease protein
MSMRNFILRRLILMIPLFLGISILSFSIVSLSPIDIVDLQTAAGANITADQKQREKERLHFVTRPETIFNVRNAESTVESGASRSYPRTRISHYTNTLAMLRFNEDPVIDHSVTSGNTITDTGAYSNESASEAMQNATSLAGANSVEIDYTSWVLDQELTILFGMNWSSAETNYQRTLFAQGTSFAATIQRPAIINNATEDWSVVTFTVGTASVAANVTMAPDEWHHYGFIYRAGTLELYFDGGLRNSVGTTLTYMPSDATGTFTFGVDDLAATADDLFIFNAAILALDMRNWARAEAIGETEFNTLNFKLLTEAEVETSAKRDNGFVTTTVTEADHYAWQVYTIDFTGIVDKYPNWERNIPVLTVSVLASCQASDADPSLSGFDTFVWTTATSSWSVFGSAVTGSEITKSSARLPPTRARWQDYLTAYGEVSILVRSRAIATDTTSLRLDVDRVQIGIVLSFETPIWEQFVYWLRNFLTGEDYSYLYNANSIDVISTFAWETVKLQFAALILSLLIAVPVGVISATRQYSKIDNLAMTGALLGVSLPVFWTGLMLILIFAFYIPIFPSGMAYTQLKGSDFPWYGTWSLDAAWHMVLPAIILGTAGAALTTRLVRSSMLEVLRQDYIMTARSKGLTERLVIYKHALRNALLPVVTIVGLTLGGMLGGAALTETVFNWPGLGRTAVVATIQRDYYLVLGINVVLSMIMIVANLLTDVSYAFLDPRIRY